MMKLENEKMKKNDKYQIVCDENMYDYFHELLEGKLRFLASEEKEASCETIWQRSLTSYNFEQIYHTRRAVYSSEEVCNELCMMDDILHIFQRYFAIPGLDRLLVNNYGAMENDIFFEYDGESGTPKKIREHYKHQYRNAYLGSLLLLNYGFLDAMTKCVQESDAVVASYIKAHTRGDEKKVKAVLYKAYFISALFHDIGYPLDFFMRKVKQIHQYAPFYKIVSSDIKTEYIELRAALAGSFLFELISSERIEEKYARNDHGCLSAISFLLSFYASGSIFTLGKEERCVIEIAALAIYKHTDRLENDYMIFAEDPLSYMVHLCDDLQEWERFLLTINEKHNYLKCSSCGSIMDVDDRQYGCGCGAKYEKITDIPNKKVNYINLCKRLKLKFDQDKKILEIYLDFDLYKQIEILLDDYCAVEKKKEDLKRVKNYLDFQKYIPKIKLNFTLSNKPLWLIHKFMEEKDLTMEQIKEAVREKYKWNEFGKDKMLEFLGEVENYISDSKRVDGDSKEEIDNDLFGYGEKAMAFVKKYLGQIHSVMKIFEDPI